MKSNLREMGSEQITIEKNLLQVKNNILQLSNISSVRVAPMEKTRYHWLLFAMIIVGFLIFIENESTIGLVLAGIGVLIVIAIYSHNNSLGEYLLISMNSGEEYAFSCYKISFLSDAVNEIKKCFNNMGKTEINFNSCSITHSNIIEN